MTSNGLNIEDLCMIRKLEACVAISSVISNYVELDNLTLEFNYVVKVRIVSVVGVNKCKEGTNLY